MPRPIEHDRSLWCTQKEAAALTGRRLRTVQRWVASEQVRTFREPGGRVLLYMPDFLPPVRLPAARAS